MDMCMNAAWVGSLPGLCPGISKSLVTSLIGQFQVFRLTSSKLNIAHSTKYFTSSNCNSMQISRKSYVRYLKYV